MVYLCCENTDIKAHWSLNIFKNSSIITFHNPSDIFNYAISDSDIFIVNLDSFDIKDTLEFVKSLPKNIKIIILKNNFSFPEAALYIKKGVKACCYNFIKNIDAKKVISTVLAGDVWVYPALMNYIIKNMNINSSTEIDINNQYLEKLTKKEKDVAVLVSSGNSNKEIAHDLNIALVTVKKHISSIFEKLDVSDRVSLSILINK